MSYKKHCLQSLFTLILITVSVFASAQKPIVTSVDKIAAGNGEIVTLQGSSFGIVKTELSVSFGAAKGVIKSVTDQLLEVMVPSGATYGKISVSHIPSGLTEYTKGDFLMSFGGNHGFGPANLEGQKDIPAETGLYDLCLCDFDGDNKTDIAAANEKSNLITILHNTTTAPGFGTLTFNKIPSPTILLNTISVHVTCGDLNGDGKPELVVSEGNDGDIGKIGDRIFIFHNTSTGAGNVTFSVQSIKLTGKNVKQVKIRDLDLDGKPELIVSNRKEGSIAVLINQSIPAAIAFNPTPITITVTDAPNTDGLAVADLDGDGFPEIITSPNLGSNLFILHNTSTSGNISITPSKVLPLGNSVVNIKVGDLDNDQRPDIAATQILGSSITVFLNQSTVGALAFPTGVQITTGFQPWGLDFGDLDGDGKPDIIVASVHGKSLSILNNESTTGNLSFQHTIKTTTYVNKHVLIGDLDGDAKPDVAYTSVDDNASNPAVLSSQISILRNTACPKPKISPEGPHTICVGFPLKLTTANIPGTSYEWNDGSTTYPPGPNAFFNVVSSGNYIVTAKAEGGTCALVSNSVSVNVEVGAGPLTGDPNARNNGPVCVGSPLTLEADPVGGTNYVWTGPNGPAGTGVNPPAIPNFQFTNAGRYILTIFSGACVALTDTTIADAITIPEFQINFGGSAIVCPPDAKILTISPALSSFTYKWFESTAPGNVLGTSTTYSPTQSGEYYVEALSLACATPVPTAGVPITFATAPVADFILPSQACRGQSLTFTNTSTVDPSVLVTYTWDFGDNTNTSNDVSPVNRYLDATTFTVKLTASYDNGTAGCTDVEPKSLIVRDAPLATITTAKGQFTFCPEGNLVLEVPGPFTSYTWNTNATTPSIAVTEAGIYSVAVTTATGCTVDASQEVIVFESPQVTIEANPSEITEGQSATLLVSGLQDFLWEPGESLSSSTIADPVASPLVTTVYTVSGMDSHGCTGEATLELKVKAGSVYGKITPSPFFSPENGDEFGKFWNVEKIEEFPHCQITIYDEKGVKVHDAKPYLNTWDGTFNGRKLPDGVYYFIIKCEGEQNSPRTGSITLLR
jgi:gliding motility-associated-like protein